MNRRVWTGVIAGVLAATVLFAVGIGSYRAGQRDEVVTRTVENGEVVRVVDQGRDFFPGFFVFPLLVILLIVLLTRVGRHRWYGPGYGGGWGDGPGWHGGWGPGPCGPGDPRSEYGPDARMREWHRRQHDDEPGTEPEVGVGAAPDDRSPGTSGPDPAGGWATSPTTGTTGAPGTTGTTGTVS